MKNLSYLILLLLISATLTSCKGLRRFNYIATPGDPYVITKDGEKYTGTSAKRDNGIFVKDKIVLGDTSFPSKNIAFYCDGSNTYANIGKKIFATQVASGPINVYKFEYTTTHYEGFNNSFSGFNNSVVGGQHTNRHASYYIQQKDKMDIKFFNLKNLSSMVPPNSPGYDILQKCKAKDKTRKIIKYSSLGLIGIGAAVGGSDAVTGVGLMGAGFVGEIVALVKRVNNYQRMYDAIQVIDSMPADKNILPSHKKVK